MHAILKMTRKMEFDGFIFDALAYQQLKLSVYYNVDFQAKTADLMFSNLK